MAPRNSPLRQCRDSRRQPNPPHITSAMATMDFWAGFSPLEIPSDTTLLLSLPRQRARGAADEESQRSAGLQLLRAGEPRSPGAVFTLFNSCPLRCFTGCRPRGRRRKRRRTFTYPALI